jgi:conjugative transfer region protein (TIGR03748 family)
MNAINFLGAMRRSTAWLGLATLLLDLSGCATANALQTARAAQRPVPLDARPPLADAPHPAQAVRSGRYTLIELGPQDGQRDLMQQVIQTSIPSSADASVADGLRFVLFRTGYQMCDAESARGLSTLPLPAAHFRLGPMTLHQALLTLLGPAWALQVDETNRSVCAAPGNSPRNAPAHAQSDEQTTPSEAQP